MLLLGAFASRLTSLRARMRKDSRSGSAAIEFAMLAMPFFLLLFGIIETGVLFFAQATLTNATEDAARLVRTGQLQGTLTAADLTQAVCKGIATASDGSGPSGLMSWQTCINTLQVDMRVYNNFSGSSYPNVITGDGGLDTANMKVDPAGACQVVLFRAYYPWHVLTPFLAPLISNMPSGTDVLLGAATAFRTEPYPDAGREATTQC